MFEVDGVKSIFGSKVVEAIFIGYGCPKRLKYGSRACQINKTFKDAVKEGLKSSI